MVWAIHAVTTVLWLINYYLEYSLLREENWLHSPRAPEYYGIVTSEHRHVVLPPEEN